MVYDVVHVRVGNKARVYDFLNSLWGRRSRKKRVRGAIIWAMITCYCLKVMEKNRTLFVRFVYYSSRRRI